MLALHPPRLRSAMKLPYFIVLAGVSFARPATGHAADATQPVDYTQRNAPFAASATVSPDITTPAVDAAVQARRVAPPVVSLPTSAFGDRRSTIGTEPAQEKKLLDKNSSRPVVLGQSMSAFDHRVASLPSGPGVQTPGLVARYQESLSAASAVNLARFPAGATVTKTKLNRFIFRKNAPDTALDADVAPAAATAIGSPATKR